MQYLEELEQELQTLSQQNKKINSANLSMYNGGADENLIKWQLNLEQEKDRIFHILKGDRLKLNEKGNEYWVEPLDKNSAILNDYGIDYVMGVLESFLNRNIILSKFEDKRIDQICLDLGNQLTNDIYNDYENMGMDTIEKRKKYPMLIMKIIINIEASLKRALDGGERSSLRKVMSVTQIDNPLTRGQMPMVSQPKSSSLLKPWTWGR